MSGKLDKSLDELLSNRRRSARRSTRRSAASKATSAAAPAGGVKKSARAARAAAKNPQPGPSGTSGTSAESKIMVSGLPADVNEANIKEYFSKSAGPVKRVMLTYNQNGTSRGIASIVFSQSGAAAKAAKDLNGLLVDGRPMKIEVIVDASHAPGVEAPKPLTERVAQVNKSQPKAATSAKAAASGRGRRGRGRRTRNPNRSKPKSVEELDAEMVDYFSNENSGSAEGNAQVNGGAQQPQQQPASGGEDVGMAEISVSFTA